MVAGWSTTSKAGVERVEKLAEMQREEQERAISGMTEAEKAAKLAGVKRALGRLLEDAANEGGSGAAGAGRFLTAAQPKVKSGTGPADLPLRGLGKLADEKLNGGLDIVTSGFLARWAKLALESAERTRSATKRDHAYAAFFAAMATPAPTSREGAEALRDALTRCTMELLAWINELDEKLSQGSGARSQGGRA